ncbi:Protein CBG15763 [Caenorhabditis briggsae]|uniref:Protein CBG15763 n=1 Tax=Caenorhabditis briggsae TaxID=6238 RepID=A8XMQ9_CAEBR|nr:Protein CBG15763 [Caenorhabditis briggsae]CAP33935.2 Protein CBG15763 [Caenorhabditis briggsae]
MEDVQKITMLAMKEDSPERDRDALLAILSFNVMLRESEAAKIKLGRSSFFNTSQAVMRTPDVPMETPDQRKVPIRFFASGRLEEALETSYFDALDEDAGCDREAGSDSSLLQKRRSQPHEENRAFNGGNSMQNKMEIGGRTSAVSH